MSPLPGRVRAGLGQPLQEAGAVVPGVAEDERPQLENFDDENGRKAQKGKEVARRPTQSREGLDHMSYELLRVIMEAM